MRKVLISLVVLFMLSACSQINNKSQRIRHLLDESQFTIKNITEEYYTQKRDTIYNKAYLQQNLTKEKYNYYIEAMQVTIRQISSKENKLLSLELFDTKLPIEKFINYQYIINSPLEETYSGGCVNGMYKINNNDITPNLLRKSCSAWADMFFDFATYSDWTLLINLPQKDKNQTWRDDFYWGVITSTNENSK